MKNKILILGEAWGEQEEAQRAPFVGASGFELTRMLAEAGLTRADCFLTNVFNLRPRPSNDITNLCGPKSEAIPGYPSLAKGQYARKDLYPELQRLSSEIRDVKPNLILALGNTATWAVLHATSISKIRGTLATSVGLNPGIKVLPTYHPAAVLRQWELRHVTVLDFIKARGEAEFPEVRRPARSIFTEPDLTEIKAFIEEFLIPAKAIAFDIETLGDQITCIGFAGSNDRALVIPFVDNRKAGGSYWPSHADEVAAWGLVRRILNLPQPKIAQNGLYDIHFLWRQYGIPVKNFEHDTMLLHHALQPESPKGLDFLGSVYTSEPAWKLMRPRGKHTIKRDE